MTLQNGKIESLYFKLGEQKVIERMIKEGV